MKKAQPKIERRRNGYAVTLRGKVIMRVSTMQEAINCARIGAEVINA